MNTATVPKECLGKVMDNFNFKAVYVWMNPLAEAQHTASAKFTGKHWLLGECACCFLRLLHYWRFQKGVDAANLIVPVMSALKGTCIARVKPNFTVLFMHVTDFLLRKIHCTLQNPPSSVQVEDVCQCQAAQIKLLQDKIAHAGQEIKRVSTLGCMCRTVTKQEEQRKHWHWCMINPIKMIVQVGAGERLVLKDRFTISVCRHTSQVAVCMYV